MYQAPATIWNEIAETQELRTTWAEQMFPLPQEDLARALENEAAKVAELAGSEVVAAAYLVVMPLLWEAQAIRAWTQEAGPNAALPPVETVDGALALAKGDYPLTPGEVQILRELLLVEPE